jgi:hypothetical protein
MKSNKIINFTNKKLKKIVNVYQLHYKNNKSSPGFGDFLRGCFSFMQLAKLLKIDFDMDMSNHPLSLYLENVNHNKHLNYNTIEFYEDMNKNKNGDVNYENIKYNINYDFLNKTISLLNSQNCNTYYFFSNAFPYFNYHNPEGINFVKNKLTPNKIMVDYIDESLINLNLKKKDYQVIHIRTGDNYLVENKKIMIDNLVIVRESVIKYISSNHNYLVISDNHIIKEYLTDIPNVYFIRHRITHLGGEKKLSNKIYLDEIKNTMLEFYLMSYSTKIISISVYGHISGFSKYCSVVYNIPLIQEKISI